MGFAKAFVALQLSVVLVSCLSTVLGDEVGIVTEAMPPHYHGHYPVMPPSHPPTPHHNHHHHGHPPSAAPVHPPSHTPSHPPGHHHGHPPSPSPVHPPSQAPSHAPGHHHHHGHPPSPSPVHPPSSSPVHPPSRPVHPPPVHPPVHAPVHPPVHPPTLPPVHAPPGFRFPRTFVAVQGVVYCKSCKYSGKDTLVGASPVLGATVKLQCNNTKYPLVVQANTDKNGYFFLQAPKTLTNYGAHKCKVSLVSSPLASCNLPSDLHGGLMGASLRPEKPFVSNKLPFLLFTVGPFAFEPKCPR